MDNLAILKPKKGINPNSLANLSKGGRKKGVPNRHVKYREALFEAFDKIGGIDTLVQWAKANQGDFYTLLIKALPKEVKADAIVKTINVADLLIDEE